MNKFYVLNILSVSFSICIKVWILRIYMYIGIMQALEYRGQHASSSSNQLVQYSEFTMDSSQSVTQPRQHQHQQPHNLDDDIGNSSMEIYPSVHFQNVAFI